MRSPFFRGKIYCKKSNKILIFIQEIFATGNMEYKLTQE